MARVERFINYPKQDTKQYLINNEDNEQRLATLERLLTKFRNDVIGTHVGFNHMKEISTNGLLSEVELRYEKDLLRDIKLLKNKLKQKG